MTVCDVFEKADVHELPVNPAAVAAALGIKVVSYGTMTEIYEMSLDQLYKGSLYGFAVKTEGGLVIAVNENSCGERRRRFTIAHELGHCVLGHVSLAEKGGFLTAAQERAADSFAAELLAPVPVLILCGIDTPERVRQICGISRAAADICFGKMLKARHSGRDVFEENRELCGIFRGFIARQREL